MRGLVYKEYLAMRGRYILAVLGSVLFVFTAARLALPGADKVAGAIESKAVRDGQAHDYYLLAVVAVLLGIFFAVLPVLLKIITDGGRRRKERAYTMALPLPADSTVKAKYIAFAAVIGTFFAVYAAMAGVYFIGAGKNAATDKIVTVLHMFPFLIAAVLLVAAIDMFAYLGLGKKGGDILMLLLLAPIALVLVWYLFFGNLSEDRDFSLIAWWRSHKTALRLIGYGLLAANIALYYASYRAVRRLELRRMAETDD